MVDIFVGGTNRFYGLLRSAWYRFDELGVELFSDSDRLSYTSLSRSSSLIQFESLERQLQNDTQISGSSPSIYSYEGANTNCNNGTVLNNQEIIEKSAPIAINLPTIKITNPPPITAATVVSSGIQFTNSDSEPYSSGSTSGSFSSDDCELHQVEIKPNDSSLSSSSSSSASSDSKSNTPISKLSENKKRSSPNFRAKNSVDSLSEDSGYCDIRDIRSLPNGAFSLDSSLPNSNDLEDEDGSVIEEKSLLSSLNQMRNLSLNSRIRSHSEDDDDDDICYHSMESLNRKFKSRKIEMNIEDSKSLISAVTTTTTTSSQRRELKIDGPKEQRLNEHNTMVKNKTENSRHSFEIQREKFISISSPELYENGDNSRKGARLKLKRNYRQSSDQFRDFCSVSSVPENLNLISIDRENSWPDITCDTVASKNVNLFDLNYGPSSVTSRQKVDISASCANLTLLNYSDDQSVDFCYDSHKLMPISRTKTSTMSKMPPPPMYNSDDEEEDDFIATYRSKELTSLLEEISAHFNKNLSILNDREASYEPQTDVRDDISKINSIKNGDEMRLEAPKPPPRARTQIKTSPNHSATTKKSTFDQDPTNLKTTYTQSLEKCNFNVDEPINVYSSRQNIYLPDINDTSKSDDLQSPVHKRNFVSSTPNLNYFDFEMRHVQHYSSIDNTALSVDHLDPLFGTNDENRCTSMKEIPSSHSRASSTGILASHSTGGSRSGLSVSFCPIVSEISWQISHDDDEEEFSDDVDMDPSAGDNFRGNRNDSLVNYYNNEENHTDDDDDDDDEEDFDDFRAVGTSTTLIPQNVSVKTHDDHVDTTPIHVNNVQHQHNHENNDEKQSIIENKASTHVDNETMEHSTNVELNKSLISHKMLVETQTPSEKLITAECQSAGVVEMDTKNTGQSLTTVPQKIVNEKTNKSSKSKKSIFSRISSGFRFSFRGKKNKKIVSDGVVHYPVETNNNSDANKQHFLPPPQQPQQSVDNKVCTNVNGDFVYIPLTNSNDNVRLFNSQNDKLASDLHQKLQNNNNNNNNNNNVEVVITSPDAAVISVDRQSRPMNKQQRESPPRINQVMGKPPLPKQPPRIVGTTTKRPNAQAPRASSTPREYEDGEFYQQNMIGNGLKQQYYTDRARTMDSGHKIGLIETNLDTDETIINGKTQSLMELGIGQNNNGNRSGLMNRIVGMGGVQVMQNVDTNINNCGNNSERGRPHKSMEFLLDKENHHIILPPENELQKARESNVTLSEHQLRVQASLQKLNIPDWYKQYSATGHNTSANTSYYKNADVSGMLKKRNSDIGRWQGLNSKTTSLSSLGSNRSDRSPVMLSPSAHSHHGGQTGFSRWSTSHLNSSQTSPSVSARSSFVRNTAYASTMSGQSVVSSTSQASEIRNSFRKPYLGWRSQEKLNQPRTAHERLASSLMSQKQADQPVATPEIQSSIKEVTSAIVHYVNDQTNRGSRSRSVSPSTRCWLESSFVGTKPLESPQTPGLENQFASSHKAVNIGPMSVTATNYDSIRLNGIGGADTQTSSTFVPSYYHPSARSSATSLEDDVILSLLGLPSDMHKSSSEDLANQPNCRGLSTFSTFKPAPVAQTKQSSATSQLTVEQQAHSRRHSEGDFQKKLLEHHSQDYEDEKSDEIRPLNPRAVSSTSTSPAPQYRRVSLDSTDAKNGDLLKCRYPKCEISASPAEAKKSFKSCHNCSHLYCSRDCRRNHWERGHRRACLHSRVSALCRQVLSTCKDDADTLKHLSLLARRGFISQGRGVVRLLFRSPENADLFIKQGFQCLGEVSFVRWPELMPQEMGPELYSELLKLSIEYKPESKMLIYVAICVVSEAPSSSTAPVKWERQLVSRCAKLKLCKSILNDKSLFANTTSSSQTTKHENSTDVLILTFNTADKHTQKSREIILANITQILQPKGISLRKNYPEVYQRLSNYVEGLTERFLPVTIHPRDSNTGKSFVCIIFPQNGDAEKIKMPPGQEGDRVQTIDVGIERTDELTHKSLNDDLFTEGTKF
ncbi:serine-rich adhesin for platelets isoform X5 [Chironomus tepperi]|uniref:serine-rich adhesin for platelets isoform X5 n=1 Tax=Chironomus tepperi TaxID=113505 RepID=UPI00391F9E2A